MLTQINFGLRTILVMLVYAHCCCDGRGQNLVLNGGFERYYKCPGSWNYNAGNRRIAPNWTSPNGGTPDLFNACGSRDAAVPYNFAGKAAAHGGEGYAGIYVWNRDREYREYLSGKLEHPLEKGKIYTVEFYFRLAPYSRYSIDRIGFLLADTLAPTPGDGRLLQTPTFTVVHDSAFRRTSGLWERAIATYRALGGERVITIGNFASNVDTRVFHIQFEPPQEPMLSSSAYFYIDDVCVTEDIWKEKTEPVPDTIATGTTYVLRNIAFDYNSYGLVAASYEELDKFAAILHHHSRWKISISGHTDDVGSDDFNLQLSINRAVSCSRYLMTKGIDASRITFSGKGKSVPIASGTDERSRAANRRVEVVFSEIE